MEVCDAEGLNGLVIVAGHKVLSWAAALSACFKEAGSSISIIGVPNTKNLSLYVPRYMPLTLGFDSARRMVSEIGGNIATDSLSSDKYWHFLRCGEAPLTVEVALQLRSTWSVVSTGPRRGGCEKQDGGSDISNLNSSANGGRQPTLVDTVTHLREVIDRRRKIGYGSGVVLLSSSLLAKLPEMEALKEELLRITIATEGASKSKPPSLKEIENEIENGCARELFKRLPRIVQMSLIQKRDGTGKPLLPKDLEPERILGRFVQQELKQSATLSKASRGSSRAFAPRFHGIEMMSSAPLPTQLDCSFGYTLGHTAGALLCEGRNFYVASCANMHRPVAEWEPCAVPFSFLHGASNGECSGAASQPVDLAKGFQESHVAQRKVYEAYRHFQDIWVDFNQFRSPGPVQFENDGASDVGPLQERPFTLLAEYFSVDELKQMIQPVFDIPRPVTLSTCPLVVRDVRVRENLSALEQRLLAYEPRIPEYLRKPIRIEDEPITPQACDSNVDLLRAFPLSHENRAALRFVPYSVEKRGAAYASPWGLDLVREAGRSAECSPREADATAPPRAEAAKPLRVGLAFTSHQAPGFHNIAAGLFDQLATLEQPVEVVGFIGGYGGLVDNHSLRITKEMVDQYRNLGGQDMIGQFPKVASLAGHLDEVTNTIRRQNLDGLVLAGHLPAQVDSAFIAEACAAERLPTRVVGVPIAWDCNFPFIQQSVGYDTVSRSLSGFVGNLGSLAQASGDTWIFIRNVGDHWSHLAVQCALRSQVNMVLLSGSDRLGQSLTDIVKRLCDLIASRHEMGYNYGTVLIPWGFIMDVTELRLLFTEIMEIMRDNVYETGWDSIHDIAAKLKQSSAAIFNSAPRDVQYEICFGARDKGTNKVDLSNISSERLLLRFVENELQRRRRLGLIEDFFNGTTYCIMYQARSAAPTQFDCDLAYSLGWAASLLVHHGRSGQLVHASGLEHDVNEWSLRGIPLTCLLKAEFDVETREHRIMPAVLQLLRQRGVPSPFKSLPREEERMILYEGPVQLLGPLAYEKQLLATWFRETVKMQDPTEELGEIARLCGELQSTMLLAKAESTLFTVNSIFSNALSALESYKYVSDARCNTKQSLADIPLEQSPLTWRMRRVDVSQRRPSRFSRFSPRMRPSVAQ